MNSVSEFPIPCTSHPSRETFSSIDDVAKDSVRFNEKNIAEEQVRRGKISHAPPPRRPTMMPDVVNNVVNGVSSMARKTSMWGVYEKAKTKGRDFQRQKLVQFIFEYTAYGIMLAFIYLVLIGLPIWKGTVYWLYWVVAHKFVMIGGFAIFMGLAAFYAFIPLFILFEKYPPDRPANHNPADDFSVRDTALLIPCYKSAGLIANTLDAAIKIFPPSQIFVIANGNSPTPLDNTEEVCKPYVVVHIWSPIGSKLVAQFVGGFAARKFKNVLIIDDECALPPNFPVVSDRLMDKIMCIGYTIKSMGPNSTRGTLCQRAQDLEYKLSGLQRAVAGKLGSATFPHGAISLWDRAFLLKTFYKHPGFGISEDWFFGHASRLLGSRITMCTSIFVETETPDSVFFSSGGARGGFGEMTIYKQRFMRWNFFFVNGMFYNLAYLIGSWKLGWAEFGAKLFVFQELIETLLYLTTPFVLPISFIVRPTFCGYLLAATIGLYFINVLIFNEVHLRLKGERVDSVAAYVYYMPYKVVLTFVNVASCYWSMFKYARYFAKRHMKVTDDAEAIEIVLRLEEGDQIGQGKGRRMTVSAIGTRMSVTTGADTKGGRPLSRVITNLEPIVDPNSEEHLTSHCLAADQNSVPIPADGGNSVGFDNVDWVYRPTRRLRPISTISVQAIPGITNRVSTLIIEEEQEDGHDDYQSKRRTSSANHIV
ncbi:uncharacterized protein PV09_03002 [Verruconis gallopava]|uniref:Uncharacterized protein n=1 Tax=Verruconis gallopava TaxID=253628 RepID=A0A0D1YYL6_9PEZI|nr:uncharacterized protein PV09_03002 [Verruconis gallopava]KIW05792.1 hypothetical protein PV09_03002 [Verruconis gallopava]